MIQYVCACMFAGKTAQLINAYDIYKRKNLSPVVIKPAVDDREGVQRGWGTTKSRLMTKEVPCYYYQNIEEVFKLDAGYILVDECQFMTKKDVRELVSFADDKNINLLAYGLKTDVNGDLFEGSQAWLVLADKVTELESLCQMPNCMNTAQVHLRYIDGQVDTSKEAVAIEKGNVTHRAVCRKCWREATK